MIYEIQSESDFAQGQSLIVKIPEHDLDRTALNAITSDKPEFILPFRYRSVDGQFEFVYQIGSLCKLQDLAGSYLSGAFSQIWFSILHPLLDCGDWFMKTYSFVLKFEHLYYDASKKSVCYIYIPSVRKCSDIAELREMAVEITDSITVEDPALENKVLRMIIKNFNPKEFFLMLKSHLKTAAQAPLVENVSKLPPEPAEIIQSVLPPSQQDTNRSDILDQAATGDIVICMPPDEKMLKAGKHKSKEKKTKKAKADKRLNLGRHSGFLNKLKSVAQEEIIIG